MPDQPPRYAYVLAPTKRVSTRRSNCRPSQVHPKVLLRHPIRRLDGDGRARTAGQLSGVEASGDTMQITSPDETAALIDQLRTAGNTHLRPGYPDHPYWRQRHRSGHRRAGSLTPQETTAQRKEEEEQLTHSPPPKARPG